MAEETKLPTVDPDHEVMVDGELAEILQDAAVESDENIIETIFMDGEDNVLTESDVVRQVLAKSMHGLDTDRIHRESKNCNLVDIAKTAVGTTQSDAELGEGDVSAVKIVEPPYPPELLSAFLEADGTHYRCVKVKVTDAVGRQYELVPTVPVVIEDDGDLGVKDTSKEGFSQEVIDDVSEIVSAFIADCNDIIGFTGVLERAGMDYEGIGWAAIEIIRSKDMKVRRIAHIPASRVRVIRGWKGFVELRGSGQVTYYQNFGDKVVNAEIDPATGKRRPYNPRVDGDLDSSKLEWNMIDRDTGKPTNNFDKSANEIVWVPKHHPNTIYYGYTDVIPAVGTMLSNTSIRDYTLQFFEHNAIPRYAIIVEGAKLAPNVVTAITKYFSTHVKGKAHKTLIIPVPAMRGEVKVRFEKLGADGMEASFQDTKKNNDQDIMTTHGVSPAIIGITDSANLGSGKGLSQAENYKDRIVTPTQLTWQRKINGVFERGLGVLTVALIFNPLDIRDRAAEKDVLIGYLGVGATNINEVRKIAGLGGPIPGGNRAFIITPDGIMYVDEMTLASSAEKQALEDQIESLEEQLSVQAMKQQLSRQSIVPGSDKNGSSKPKAKPENVRQGAIAGKGK